MEDDELLLNVRQIVRDEISTVIERMDARFDQVEPRFHDLFARLDRYQSQLVSLRTDFDRVGTTPASPTSSSVTSNRA